MLAVCLALNCQLATFVQAYQSLLLGWIGSSFLAIANEPDPSPTQASAGAHEIMNHESTPLRLRAFRVTGRKGGTYSKWIVLEDLQRTQFRVANYVAFGGAPTRGLKQEMDKDDAWNVLNCLRNATRIPEKDRSHWPTADSIDDAISQEEIRMQELWDQAPHSTAPSSFAREHEPSGKKSKPLAMAIKGSGPSEEELQQLIKEVWDFAGGKRLKWRRMGRTPAGRKCEVLTFDGQVELLVGLTSVGVSN